MDAIDTTDLTKREQVQRPEPSFWSLARHTISSWLLTWEIYPIILVAAFLRFYRLPLTELDADQAILFSMPREAFLHGLIPATGTVSSIKMVNPPGYIYFLMPIAAFISNPLAGAFFTALLNVLAVFLVYIFTRRYYGRLAGTVAALLYATTVQDIIFSRFIWQPNLFPFFTIIFMLALFWGAVERRPGWLLPALLLLGCMLQLHTTAIYMAIPLAIALLLAYKNVRWRDLILGSLLILLMFSTYFIWLAATHFADLKFLLAVSGGQAHVDTQGLVQYLSFLIPYISTPDTPQSLLPHLVPFLRWGKLAVYIVISGGFFVAVLGLLGWKHIQLMPYSHFPTEETHDVARTSLWQKALYWWNTLAASPQRRSLLLLLAWQIPPLVLFSRHSIDLQPQYVMVLLPGSFILIGLFFSQIVSWCGMLKELSKLLRFATLVLSIVLILTQLIGSCTWLFDEAHGYHYHGNAYNTLQDVEGAVNTADQLAQARHLHHVYIIAGSDLTYFPLHYLASEMKTPTTLLSDPYSTWKYLQGQVYAPPSSTAHCLILPSPSQGPAVMLLEPNDLLDIALLTHFTAATLVSEPTRLGGQPFRIYVVQPLPATSGSQVSFTHALALSTKSPGTIVENQLNLLETRWTNLKNLPAKYGTTYNYHFVEHASGNGTDGATSTVDCNFTSLTPGEELLVPFNLPAGNSAQPVSLSISGSTRVTSHITLQYGPLDFQSILDQRSVLAPFQSSSGGGDIVVQSQVP
ncbi:glycosyltransferase family 39 protein [Ktedonobacter robiniae]|uniref:Glycosyltransferase RgtA/B/C/D-like domain-containing protein n=1 Tax=Ktedonobacter robiniae TaxID=2778365 RepID=A0ABQ3UKF5_9CHLR|nr:glycosyltransferase family 39 protein [Ktedonobacter robiniae]GHO53212.1 hypothetical protein KSB_16870 [Ktedonobacter robiniae]